MNFQLKPQDLPLIEAAIGLGDWLAGAPGHHAGAEGGDLLLQDGLRRLPAVTPANSTRNTASASLKVRTSRTRASIAGGKSHFTRRAN